MATDFKTKVTITRPPGKIIARCLHLPSIFRSGLSDGVVKISSLPTPVAMATNFETKLTITRHPQKIIASCFHLPSIFGPALSDGVIWIFSLTTLIAMAKNFETKIDYYSVSVKNNCALFAPTRIFSGPGYPMVSFKFLFLRPLLPWQQILGQNWL